MVEVKKALADPTKRNSLPARSELRRGGGPEQPLRHESNLPDAMRRIRAVRRGCPEPGSALDVGRRPWGVAVERRAPGACGGRRAARERGLRSGRGPAGAPADRTGMRGGEPAPRDGGTEGAALPPCEETR